ncbi:MAG: tape measure protein [Peptococcaceae bacterium]|nr:tape measure protein [Peptococcaceae bacterium]
MQVGELFVKLGVDLREYTKGLQEAQEKVKQTGSMLRQVFASAAGVMAGIAGWQGLTAAIRGTIGAGISFNAQLEQTQIAFRTLTGSAAEAQKMIEDLREFTKSTPFEFPQLQQAATRLMALGFASKDVLPMLKAIGDAASGLGIGAEGINRITLALGQMAAKGKVTGEEIMQLQEAGIKADEILAKAWGKSTAEIVKMREDGLIPAGQAIEALIKGMEENFPNMMVEQNKSFTGMMSNIKDAFNDLFGRILEPSFNWLKNDILPKIMNTLEQMADVAKKSGIKEALKIVIPPEVVNSIWAVGSVVKDVFNFIRQHGEAVKAVVMGIASAFIAWKAAIIGTMIVEKLSGAVRIAREAITMYQQGVMLATIAQWGMQGALAGTRVALIAATGGIALLVPAAYELYKHWGVVWPAVKDIAAKVAQAVVGIFNAMVTKIAIAWNELKNKLWNLLAGILNALSPVAGIIGRIAPGFEAGFENLRAAVANKIEDVQVNLQELNERFDVAVGNIKAAGAGIGDSFKGLLQGLRTTKNEAEAVQDTKLDVDLKNWSLAGADAGNALEEAGKKGKEAAEDTRAAWERAADILSTRLQIIQAQQEIAAIAAERHGNQAQALADKITWLNRQLDVQKQIIAAVTQGYEESVQAKGADAEETLKLALRLEQEKKAQADIEKQTYDTTQAIKDQAKELRDLAGEVANLAEEYEAIEKKMRNDLAAAAEEYQRKVAEVNDKLIEDERRVTEEYEKAVADRAKALRDFVGLFDKVTTKDVSGKELLENLRGQVKTFEEWSANIQALAARGVDEGLIQELREMGPKAAPEIAALNTLTDAELAEYVRLWREKNAMARAEAVNQLVQQRIEMQQKLIEIRMAAQEQLEQYRVEWEKKNAEIRKNAEEEMARIEKRFKEIAEAGSKYGASLVVNFAEAARSRFDDLRRMLEEMAAMIDSYMPHSPAKRGPLARIMEWGPSLVRELTEGIRRSLPSLEDMTARMAALSPGALAPAIATSYSTTNAYYGGNTIYIQVSGGNNASDLADQLLREWRKRGVRL